MLFQIKEGTAKHYHNGQVFLPGDTIETDVNLDKAFPYKFVRLDAKTNGKVTKTALVKEVGETEVSHPKWGIQVTAKFDDAVLLGYDVYYHAGKDGYAILEGPEKIALKKREKDVVKFLSRQAANMVGSV